MPGMSTPVHTAPDPAAGPPKLAIAGVLVALFLSAIDGTIVGTAMPSVVGTIGGLELYPWVFSGFMLASTVVMPFYGKGAEIWGVKRCLYVAIALFLLGSVACGSAGTMVWLVAGRVLQGLGAGGITTLTLVAFGQLFRPEQRGKAQSLFSLVWGVSTLLGPLAGGLLVTHLPWQWIFWINLPAGLLAGAFVVLAYPGAPGAHPHDRLNWFDGALLAGGLTALMAGLSAPSPAMLALSAAGLMVLGWFLRRQATSAAPLVPLDAFKQRTFALCAALGFLSNLTMFAAITYVPLLMQGVWGRSAPEAGIAMTPMMFGWPVAAALAGMLVNRLGFRALTAGGAMVMCVGYALLGFGLAPAIGLTAAEAGLLGLGMGSLNAVTMIAAQTSVPRHRIGTASSSFALVRNIGASLGVTLFGGIQLWSFHAGLAARGVGLAPAQVEAMLRPDGAGGTALSAATLAAAREALAGSLQVVFLASLALAVVTVVLALLMPPISPAEAAKQVEAEA